MNNRAREDPPAAAESVQYLHGSGDFVGKNLSRCHLRFIYFVYLCRKIKKYLLSERSISNAALSPRHMGTKADRDTTCKGHAARSRIWSIEPGRPCSIPTEEASAMSPRRVRLSADSQVQETICQRLLKRESKAKQLTCKKWELEM